MRRILIGLALTFVALPAWAQTQVEQAEAMANDIVANKNDPMKGDPMVRQQMAKFLSIKATRSMNRKAFMMMLRAFTAQH